MGLNGLNQLNLRSCGRSLDSIRRDPLGLANSALPARKLRAALYFNPLSDSRLRHTLTKGVRASLQSETSGETGSLPRPRADHCSPRVQSRGLRPHGLNCSCSGHKSASRGAKRHVITSPNAANPWGASNGAVRDPEGKASNQEPSREWTKNVFWEDDADAAAGRSNGGSRGPGGNRQGSEDQKQKQKWQAQWQRFRQTMLEAADAIRGKKKAAGGAGGVSGQAPELKNVISDVRRLGMSGILFGAISMLHFYGHGRLSPYADTVLDTLSLVWFVFMVLDMVLTSTTWIAGAQAFSLLMATCPSCGGVFYYSRDSFQGCMSCPKCFEEMRWDGARFVRDRPRFSRVNFGNDAFGYEPEDPTPPKQKIFPIVDVDATVNDK